MSLIRGLALAVIGGLLVVGALIDLGDRTVSLPPAAPVAALTVSTGPVTTWFCPGGSGPDGVADLTVELISASQQRRRATVSVLPGGPGSGDAGSSGLEIEPLSPVVIEPLSRVVIEPSNAVPGAAWVGVVVEVDGSDVVVEQIVASEQGDVGRSPCLTRTSDRWVVLNGATRLAVQGERFIVMLLNPFPDFAVADIDLVADVGRDSIEGLVIPAQRVVAVDVTDEVTVAGSVTAFVDVVAGRLSVSSIQLSDGPIAGSGTRIAPATPDAGALWHLPVAATGPGRRDVVAVANPSPTVAEVDLEVMAEAPGVSIAPIELTVQPGRTILVDLSRQGPLEGLSSFSVVARSLAGVPVAASISSVTSAVTDDGEPTEAVVGASATTGADAAARRWLLPVEAAAGGGPGSDTSSVVVVNPSTVGIALVEVSVGGEVVRSLEVGPGRRSRLPLAGLALDRFVVELDSSVPVIVGRELVGLTSRTAALGVAVSPPVPVADIR